jgi:hypothetical protein
LCDGLLQILAAEARVNKRRKGIAKIRRPRG